MIQGSLTLGWSVASLMTLVFALTLVLAFQFTSSPWVLAQITWIPVLGLKFLLRITPEQIRPLLDETFMLTAMAGFVVFLAWQQMRSRAMHRKVAQRPFISIVDLKNKDRVEEFKRLRDMHKARKSEGVRPLDGLLQSMNRRVAAHREAGNHGRALMWEAGYLSLATSIPRGWWRLALLLGFFPVAMILAGYFDSRAVMKLDESMVGWFSGLFFIMVSVMGTMAYHLRVRSMGRLFSRRDMLRSGWLGAGVMVGAGLASSLLLFGVAQILVAVLPPVNIGDCVYTMIGPRPHVLGAALFVLPVQLLVFTLWRRPGSTMVLQQTGTMIFFFFHGFHKTCHPTELA